MDGYSVVLHSKSFEQIQIYKNDLLSGKIQPGAYLSAQLSKLGREDLKTLTDEKFIDLILATKKPRICAATGIQGAEKDWNREEISILGNIAIAVPVEIYDNGVWNYQDPSFKIYPKPITGELLFVPGPLLGSTLRDPPDFVEVVINRVINQEKYNLLLERRIAPLLEYASTKAAKEGKRAFVTVPGIGSGSFSGPFQKTLKTFLNKALQFVIDKNSESLSKVACVYFDPFSDFDNETHVIKNIKYRVRPFLQNKKSQLSKPEDYQEEGDDFSNCILFKIVASDHVAYPGNDFYSLSRTMDEGVSAAATNSMKVITGVNGEYKDGKYKPVNYNSWEEVVEKNEIKLKVNNLFIFPLGRERLDRHEDKSLMADRQASRERPQPKARGSR